MKWSLFLVTFFTTLSIFAMGEDIETTNVTITTDSYNNNNDIPDPCLDSKDAYTREQCEQLWQEQRMNISPGVNETDITSTHREVTGPSLSPLPAWEQAIQPQATTTINTEREGITPIVVPQTPSTRVPEVIVPPSSTSISPTQVPVVGGQVLLPESGDTITSKEVTTTVQENDDTKTVNKQTTISNQDGNIEAVTTTTESVIHIDAPP